MDIDLSEFHDVFFEECSEGLDVMESGLLNLDQNTDVEEINGIFRAAHSIKGGGASFGFMELSEFTHVMETLLDEMRDGRRAVTSEGVDVLLKSVDVLRGMIDAAREKEEADETRTAEVRQLLDAMLGDTDGAPAVDDDQNEAPTCAADIAQADDSKESIGWRVELHTPQDFLESGSDPLKVFEELQSLGDLTVNADTSRLPAVADIDVNTCYLSWTLELRGDVSRADVSDALGWISDESGFTIEPLSGPCEAVDETDGAPEPQETEHPAPAAIQSPSETSAPEPTVVAAKKAKAPASSKDAGSIRVATDKVDALINMVGELVITQSMLSQIGSQFEAGHHSELEKLQDGLAQLERNTRELQESVLQIRMLPVSFSFSRFPRLVRDLSSKLNKKIELKMTGEHTEVDKTVLEKIGDPLVHLVRNSLDHGIETPEERIAKGKPETGTVELLAYHEGGDIVIKVIDDGAGLDGDRILRKAIEKGVVSEGEELTEDRIHNLIFAPGFSTAEELSDVSGRGVGMDVVRRNVRDLGGNVSIASNDGAGSTVTIRLPLTLAILDGQLFRVNDQTYIVSLVSIVESLQMSASETSSVAGESELYKLRDEYIPVIRMADVFGLDGTQGDFRSGLLMVVESDRKRYGLFVDDLLGQQQVVIKSLETNFKQIQGISGATILGDGTVALIIDVPGVIQNYYEKCASRERSRHAAA